MKDAGLRRFERDAVVACAAASAIALVVPGGGWRMAAAVLGGGVLIAVSYWGIKSGVERLVRGAGGSRRRIAWPLVLFAGRYALLGFLAYVMIARLRLHPIGLLIGASSVVVAAVAETIRFLRRPRAQRPRTARPARERRGA